MSEYNELNTKLKGDQEFNNTDPSIKDEDDDDEDDDEKSSFSINKKLISLLISAVVFASFFVLVIFKDKDIKILKQEVSYNSYYYKIENKNKNDNLFIFLTNTEKEKDIKENDISLKHKLINGVNEDIFYNLGFNKTYYVYIYSFLNNKKQKLFLKSKFQTISNKNTKFTINNNLEITNNFIKINIDTNIPEKNLFSIITQDKLENINKDNIVNFSNNNFIFNNLKPNSKYFIKIYKKEKDKYTLLYINEYNTK